MPNNKSYQPVDFYEPHCKWRYEEEYWVAQALYFLFIKGMGKEKDGDLSLLDDMITQGGYTKNQYKLFLEVVERNSTKRLEKEIGSLVMSSFKGELEHAKSQPIEYDSEQT